MRNARSVVVAAVLLMVTEAAVAFDQNHAAWDDRLIGRSSPTLTAANFLAGISITVTL